MANEEQMLSVLNRSGDFPILERNPSRLDDGNSPRRQSKTDISHTVPLTRVSDTQLDDNVGELITDGSPSVGKVGGELFLEEDQEADYTTFNRRHAGQFLPQLVFLDSDENLQNIPDTTDSYQDQTQYHVNVVDDSRLTQEAGSKIERSLSESYATADNSNDLSQNRRLKNDDNVTNSLQNLQKLLPQSQMSRQSSDSELLTDLLIAPEASTSDYGYTDTEMYAMTDIERSEVYNKLSKWHCHDHGPPLPPDRTARNQLIAVSVLCFLFMVGEAVGGAISNSLALFTDVLHLGSDLISFLISLLAIYLARKPPTRKMSFGYYRAEVLGALFSVFIIWSVTGVLIYMAVERIIHQHYKDVKPDEMLITASLGVVFNVVMGFVLHSEMCCGKSKSAFGHNHSLGSSHSHSNSNHSNGNHVTLDTSRANVQYGPYEPLLNSDEFHELGMEEPEEVTDTERKRPKNINVRAAFIHVIGDILQSIGVLIASLVIKLTPDERYRLADPICTFLFSILVLFTTITVLRDTLQVIMEGVPRDTNYFDVKMSLQKIPGVKAVHGLNIWCLTLEKNAIAVHLVADPKMNPKHILLQASEVLRKDHNFVQTTIQVEDYRPDIMAKCMECQELHK